MHQGLPFGSRSLFAAAVTLLLAQDFHPVLLAALHAGETASWLAVLVAGVVAALCYWPVAVAIRSIPGGNLLSLAQMAAGPIGGIVTSALVTGLAVYHAGFILRQTSEMTVSSIYPHTPETFAMVGLVLCTLYGAYGSLNALVRLSRAFLPILVLSILVILAGTFGWGELRYLLPFWGPGPAALLTRSVALSTLYTPGMLFLWLAAGQLRDRKYLVPAGMLAIGSSSVLIAATKVILCMTFPLPLGFSISYPLHELACLVTGGRFFERIEALWVYVWFVATTLHIGMLLHVAASSYAQAVGVQSHRLVVVPLMMMAVTVALFPPDQNRAIVWHAAAWPVALGIGFGWPLVLTILFAVRRRLTAHVA